MPVRLAGMLRADVLRIMAGERLWPKRSRVDGRSGVPRAVCTAFGKRAKDLYYGLEPGSHCYWRWIEQGRRPAVQTAAGGVRPPNHVLVGCKEGRPTGGAR